MTTELRSKREFAQRGPQSVGRLPFPRLWLLLSGWHPKLFQQVRRSGSHRGCHRSSSRHWRKIPLSAQMASVPDAQPFRLGEMTSQSSLLAWPCVLLAVRDEHHHPSGAPWGDVLRGTLCVASLRGSLLLNRDDDLRDVPNVLRLASLEAARHALRNGGGDRRFAVHREVRDDEIHRRVDLHVMDASPFRGVDLHQMKGGVACAFLAVHPVHGGRETVRGDHLADVYVAHLHRDHGTADGHGEAACRNRDRDVREIRDCARQIEGERADEIAFQSRALDRTEDRAVRSVIVEEPSADRQTRHIRGVSGNRDAGPCATDELRTIRVVVRADYAEGRPSVVGRQTAGDDVSPLGHGPVWMALGDPCLRADLVHVDRREVRADLLHVVDPRSFAAALRDGGEPPWRPASVRAPSGTLHVTGFHRDSRPDDQRSPRRMEPGRRVDLQGADDPAHVREIGPWSWLRNSQRTAAGPVCLVTDAFLDSIDVGRTRPDEAARACFHCCEDAGSKIPGFDGVHLPEKPQRGLNGKLPVCDGLSARWTVLETRLRP